MTVKRGPIQSVLCALTLCLLSSGCGSGSAPVLELMISNASPMGTEIDVTVTKAGKTATAKFYRDKDNKYSATFPTVMPPMMMAPTTPIVALDLPAGTAGAVSVKVGSYAGMIGSATPNLQLLTVGCLDTIITDGALNAVSVTLAAPSGSCQ